MKNSLILSIVVGIVCGIISSFPFSFGPIPSLSLWAIAAILLGYRLEEIRTIIWSGILFGISLSITFLFCRFGGAVDKILSYLVLVVGLSVVGALAGIVTVFLGSKLRKISHQ